MALMTCPENACRPTMMAPMNHSHQFSLDFRTDQTDNLDVVTMWNLIYSPSDMPKGLWRGFAFMGNAGRIADAH